jgi:hypothetical protein
MSTEHFAALAEAVTGSDLAEVVDREHHPVTVGTIELHLAGADVVGMRQGDAAVVKGAAYRVTYLERDGSGMVAARLGRYE